MSHDGPGMPAVLFPRTEATDNKSRLCAAISRRPLPALMRLYLPLLQVCRTYSQPGSSSGGRSEKLFRFSARREKQRQQRRQGCSTPATPLPATREHDSQLSRTVVFRYFVTSPTTGPSPPSPLRIPPTCHSPSHVIPALTVTLTHGRIPSLPGSAHSL